MFGVFIFLAVALQMVTQIIPLFVTQRTLYEARERPSKTYSWKVFMIANIVVEVAWNSVSCAFNKLRLETFRLTFVHSSWVFSVSCAGIILLDFGAMQSQPVRCILEDF